MDDQVNQTDFEKTERPITRKTHISLSSQDALAQWEICTWAYSNSKLISGQPVSQEPLTFDLCHVSRHTITKNDCKSDTKWRLPHRYTKSTTNAIQPPKMTVQSQPKDGDFCCNNHSDSGNGNSCINDCT